jgi:hypothetical protein
MVSAALSWLGGNPTCDPMATSLARAKTSGTEFAQRYPRPRHPSAAQWWLPGLE